MNLWLDTGQGGDVGAFGGWLWVMVMVMVAVIVGGNTGETVMRTIALRGGRRDGCWCKNYSCGHGD